MLASLHWFQVSVACLFVVVYKALDDVFAYGFIYFLLPLTWQIQKSIQSPQKMKTATILYKSPFNNGQQCTFKFSLKHLSCSIKLLHFIYSLISKNINVMYQPWGGATKELQAHKFYTKNYKKKSIHLSSLFSCSALVLGSWGGGAVCAQGPVVS